jgi:hypothetical protein
MRRILLRLLVALTAGVALGATVGAPPATLAEPRSGTPFKLNMPGPDVQNLMLGTWKLKVEYAPTDKMPKGAVTEATEVWRAGPGGLSVIEEYHESGVMGEIEAVGTLWWDTEAGGRRFLWCENANPKGCDVSKAVFRWEGERMVYREDKKESGKKITVQEVFQDIAPNSFTQILSQGPAGGEIKAFVTLHATRQK